MGLLHLVPLLAFLPKILLQGLPTDPPPPPPSITVTPEKTEYLIGDNISIRCAAPRAPSAPSKLQGFQLARTGSWLEVRSPWRSHTFSLTISGPRDGGPHACTYTALDRLRRPTRSRESRVVDIKVRDPPAAPTLLLNATSGVVSEGSPLLFLCTAPAGAVGPRFRIFKDGSEIPGEILENFGGHQIRLLVAASGRNHSGNFSCGYEERVRDRWILSVLSEPIEVVVKEPPSPPRLDVDPPELSAGAPLRLTCLAPGAAPGLRFHFFRNGVEIPRSPPDPQNPQNSPNPPGNTTGGSSSVLLIPKIPQNFGGVFSCGFEEDVGGTWVASPESQGLEVVVKAPALPVPLVAGCVAAAAAVLLGLLGGVCFCHRRRGGAHWKGLYDKEEPGTYPMSGVDRSEA